MIGFDQTDFNLGNIKYGDTKVVTVNITNTSTETVELTPMNSSCSCTTGSLKQNKLAPNERTQFNISLNSVKAGKGTNQVKSIQLNYKLNKQTLSQVFRLKANVV